MAATSLWELRKRPLPRGVVSPLDASPAPPSSRRKPTPSGKIRRQAKENCKASRGLATAFDAADRCMYRGGGTCFAPRTFKDCGARHSLCAMHRDRTITNQRRYDEKRRLKKIQHTQMEVEERKEKRDRDRSKRLAKANTEVSCRMHLETTEKAILPSFQAWTATFTNFKTGDGGVNVDDQATEREHDSSRAWLQPFQPAADVASFAGWRDEVVAEVFRES